jgi:cell division protein ZapA (FtsZ GTPase activity inhibitor)
LDEIIKIDLFGEEFRFKPDEQVKDPDKVAQYLKDYIKEAEDLFQNKNSGRNKIAILLLAAMNLSKDFCELKQQHSELKKDVDKRISSLMYKIDKGIE